jgi:hypothetical protein
VKRSMASVGSLVGRVQFGIAVLTTWILATILIIAATPALAQCPLKWTFTGAADYDRFGTSVAWAGDVNNDGIDDIIVGAPGNSAGGTSAGRAYVYSGAAGALLYTFTGAAAQDFFGQSVSGAGDVNGDGFADVIVGAYWNDAGGVDAGRAYVYSGQTGALIRTLTGQAAGDRFGISVASAGDVNSDGYDDVIVGAYQNDAGGVDAGRAYVYSGLNGSLLWTLTGAAAGDWFGYSVSGAGDVNDDGYADIVVGARNNAAGGIAAGRAYVYSGATGVLLHTFTGAAAGDEFGISVSGAGDMDKDGFTDLIIGAWRNDAGGAEAGRAYVYSGQMGTLMRTFTAQAANDRFGFSVAGAGDVNGDGYADLMVGARDNDAGGQDAGRVYVYSGLTGALLSIYTGTTAGEGVGTSVDGGGKIGPDSYADLLIGASGYSSPTPTPGHAYAYSCSPPTGACCEANGSCTDGVTETDCLAGGGIYRGDGSSCFETMCPTSGFSVIIPAQRVSPGATGVQIPIFLRNDADLEAFTIPLIIRQVTPGAFITSLAISYADRLPEGLGQPLSDIVVKIQYANEDGNCKSGQPGGFQTATYSDGLPHPVSSSPEGVLFGRVKAGSPPLIAGRDTQGSLQLTVNVTSTPGSFDIDTSCTQPATHIILLQDGTETAVLPFFTKGTVTIGSPRGACCDPLGACITGLTEAECLACGGTYKGDGSDCSAVPPCGVPLPAVPHFTGGISIGLSGEYIWTPFKFYETGAGQFVATELFDPDGRSVTDIQGVVQDDIHSPVIWTPSKVYLVDAVSIPHRVTEVTDPTSLSIGEVRGAVFNSVGEVLLWTPLRVYYLPSATPPLPAVSSVTTATEVTFGGASISDVRGIVHDDVNEALIWTPSALYLKPQSPAPVSEVVLQKIGPESVSGIEGIVSNDMNEALIWTMSHVYRRQPLSTEVLEINSTGPTQFTRAITASPRNITRIWNNDLVAYTYEDSLIARAVRINLALSPIHGASGVVGGLGEPPFAWNPDCVYEGFHDPWVDTVKMTGFGSPLSGVWGIAWDSRPAPTVLMWRDDGAWVYLPVGLPRIQPEVDVISAEPGPMYDIRGILFDRTDAAYIWTGSRVYIRPPGEGTVPVAQEVTTLQGNSISAAEGVVINGQNQALILTNQCVYRTIGGDPLHVREVTEVAGGPISAYDPLWADPVQAITHSVLRHEDTSHVDCIAAAGIKGRNPVTPALYAGYAFGATNPRLPYTGNRCDIVGAASHLRSDIILGPNPVAGVVNGNSAMVFGYYKCLCPHQGDIDGSGFIDVTDVLKVIQIAFLNGIDTEDPFCPNTRGDVNGTGVVDVNDVLYIIKTAFTNGPPPVNPCGP